MFYFLKELDKESACDVTQRIKDIECYIETESIQESAKPIDNVNTQQHVQVIHEEKKQIISGVKSISNIMATIVSENPENIGKHSAENNPKYATSSKAHNEGVIDEFDENNVLHMAKNNLKKVEKYHDHYNEQKTELHLSASEENQSVTKEKVHEISDKHHESKRISPPKNVNPVIAGTSMQLLTGIFINHRLRCF